MNWSTLYCPNRRCCSYGVPFPQGMVVRNGSRDGAKQGICRAWEADLLKHPIPASCLTLSAAKGLSGGRESCFAALSMTCRWDA